MFSLIMASLHQKVFFAIRPPGCSKTMMAKAVFATESSMNFIAVKVRAAESVGWGFREGSTQFISKGSGSSTNGSFFDEIDAMATKRGSGGDSSSKVVDRVLSQLLVELDGVDHLNQVVVLAATNRPDMLDSALLRPGRIDYLVHVGLPEAKARAEILNIHMRKIPIGETVLLDKLVDMTKATVVQKL